MTEEKEKEHTHKCYSCGHEWTPKNDQERFICPKCGEDSI